MGIKKEKISFMAKLLIIMFSMLVVLIVISNRETKYYESEIEKVNEASWRFQQSIDLMTFNDIFIQYEGEAVSGEKLNELYVAIEENIWYVEGEKIKLIHIDEDTNREISDLNIEVDIESVYKVECFYDGTGVVNEIVITVKF